MIKLCAAQDPVMTAAMIALFVVMALTILTIFALIFLSYERSKNEEPEAPLPPEEPKIIYEPQAEPHYLVDTEPTERIVPVPVVIPFAEEESFAAGAVRYDRSFLSRLIQADDATKSRYTQLKNFLLGFSKVKDKLSWKHESYRCGREAVATLLFRGKTLCILLPIPAKELENSKFRVEPCEGDESRCLYRLKSDLRLRYAKELLEALLINLGAEKTERESVDYFLPYEGLVELIDKGLIKRKITSKATEDFLRAQKESAAIALSK